MTKKGIQSQSQEGAMTKHTLTVRELIAELEKVKNKNLPVWTEGCDCWGEAMGILEEDNEKDGTPKVLITRLNDWG